MAGSPELGQRFRNVIKEPPLPLFLPHSPQVGDSPSQACHLITVRGCPSSTHYAHDQGKKEGKGGVPATTSLSIRKAENSPQALEQATPTLPGQNWVAKETRTDHTDLHQYDSSQGSGTLSQQGRPGLCEVGGRRTDIDRNPGLAPQMKVPDML